MLHLLLALLTNFLEDDFMESVWSPQETGLSWILNTSAPCHITHIQNWLTPLLKTLAPHSMSHMSLFGPRYSWACLNEAIVCGREGPGIGGNRSQRGPTPATSQLQRLHALPLHVAEETTTNQFSNEIVPGIPGFPRSAALWKTPDTEWERRGMTGQEGGREGGGTYWRTVTGQYEKKWALLTPLSPFKQWRSCGSDDRCALLSWQWLRPVGLILKRRWHNEQTLQQYNVTV